MSINIKNCNSIDEANIIIENGKLNIKYGINGTGKSTIAKAISFHNKPELLQELLPFKYIENNPDDLKPSIDGTESYEDIMIFNEDYINQFVFKKDELLENSFEIFIKDKKFDENLLAVEALFLDVKSTFQTNEHLTKILIDLNELSSTFSKTKGGVAQNSKIMKALGEGNKIDNIPEGLEDYSDYLTSEKNTAWIKWQSSGKGFLEISDKCPYCTSSISAKKETIERVSTEYNDKSIEHLLKIIEVMDSLKIYFTEKYQQTIEKVTKNKIALNDAEKEFLKTIYNQINVLIKQLMQLNNLAFSTFKDVDDMTKKINELKIDLDLVPALKSSATEEIINPLNNLLEELLVKARELKGKINKQKQSVVKKIEIYKTEINEFLKYAGYKYIIDIEEVKEEYKLRLQHSDISSFVENGNQHLSYGEKNAFALMLFMYDCLSKSPDLIILDDPISSFDKNKKFAIIDRLFRGEKSFKGKTVLLLTHDIDPIIDMFKVLYGKIEPIPVASFIKSRNGIIEEIPILKDDLQTFAQVCDENILICNDDINKLIYLRRYFEVLDDKSEAYQLLASLFHKRDTPIKFTNNGEVEMTPQEIDNATNIIKEKIVDFSYSEKLSIMLDVNNLKSIYSSSESDYEKLQLFRLIHEVRHSSDVIQKFINETFHIENEYISQLNPRKYEIIPEFIIQECDRCILTNEKVKKNDKIC